MLLKKKNEDTGKSNPWLETHTRSDETILNMFDAEKIQSSQRRYARLLGCKWASSGFYHLRKLFGCLIYEVLTNRPTLVERTPVEFLASTLLFPSCVGAKQSSVFQFPPKSNFFHYPLCYALLGVRIMVFFYRIYSESCRLYIYASLAFPFTVELNREGVVKKRSQYIAI